MNWTLQESLREELDCCPGSADSLCLSGWPVAKQWMRGNLTLLLALVCFSWSGESSDHVRAESAWLCYSQHRSLCRACAITAYLFICLSSIFDATKLYMRLPSLFPCTMLATVHASRFPFIFPPLSDEKVLLGCGAVALAKAHPP